MNHLESKRKIIIGFLIFFVLLWGACYVGDLVDEKKHNKSINKNINNEITEDYDITMRYGYLGQYGRYVSMNGEYYIVYEIPAGKYRFKGISNLSTLFYSNNNIVLEEGEYMYELIKTMKLYKDDSFILEVAENTNFELSINSYVTIEKVD